jgi:hypothetical protein
VAWSYLNIHGQAASNATATVTINSTGADFLVVAVAYFSIGSAPSVTDNKSNTWVQRTAYLNTISGADAVEIWYLQNGAVGSNHQISVGTSRYNTISVEGFSGSATNPYDTESGNIGDSTAGQPGSITPAGANELLIAALASDSTNTGGTGIDSSFTLTDTNNGGTSGINFGGSIAYLIDSSGSAIDPTWSWTGTGNFATSIASFKAAAGGGFTAVNRRTLGPRVGSRSVY